jgi:protein gp37
MSRNTPIEWTDDSWPIIAGCKECSPGCANCYAARLTATRLKQQPKYKGLAVIGQNGHPHFTGETRLWKPHLDWPLKWKKPRTIFPANMSDLFYEGVSDEEIAAVFGVMAACPQHTFQVLTKRAERMAQWFEWISDAPSFLPRVRCVDAAVAATGILLGNRRGDAREWPLRNVWLGVSVESQEYANERIPRLLRTPAVSRFLSCEPLLGPLALSQWFRPRLPGDHPDWKRAVHTPDGPRDGIDWVIVGGESGPLARRCEVKDVRSVVRQCTAAGVPCFVKQLGAVIIDRNDAGWDGLEDTDWDLSTLGDDAVEHDLDGTRDGYQGAPVRVHLRDRKGGDMQEWPLDLRVRQFPEEVRG